MREELLARTFVELADTLVNDYDVIDFLELLAQRCVALLTIEEAGIVLDDQRGNLKVLASSSERMRLVELFELQTEEGPCLDCFRSGEPVRADDLEAAGDRWPRFGPSALEAGFRSVYALPMRLRHDRIGALNLFANRPAGLVPPEEVLGQALADVATISILQQRFLHEHQALTEQLQTALNTRVVLEQAKGMVAEQGKVEIEAAFTLLRDHARDQNVTLAEVARSVIEGRLDATGLRRRRGATSR
ncbi:MAG TPA: GAF and ANTAR domain-containing protein [Acidimicrobiales bacterium]|nr:GAF and ANTAR domain-containing protein [Acidimicrobiales bacterium]